VIKSIISLILIVHVVDLHSYARNYVWTVDKKYVYPSGPLIKFLKINQEEKKIVALGTNLIPDSYLWHGLRVVGGRGFFTKETNDLYKNLGMDVEGQGPTQKFFYSKSFVFDHPYLDYMGIKYIVSAPLNKQEEGIDSVKESNLKLVYSGDDGTVYEIKDVNGPIQLVDMNQIIVARESASKFNAQINRIDFDITENRNTILRQVTQRNSIEIIKDKNDIKEIRVETTGNSTLIIGNNYNKNWVAKIDGRPVAIKREMNYFMSLEVPEGKHFITLKYRPPSYYFAILSIFAFGSNIIFFRRNYRKKRI
jgi:hypothetical protein